MAWDSAQPWDLVGAGCGFRDPSLGPTTCVSPCHHLCAVDDRTCWAFHNMLMLWMCLFLSGCGTGEHAPAPPSAHDYT